MADVNLPMFLSSNRLHFSPDPGIQSEVQKNPFIFLGPRNSMSYPLHQNFFTGDVVMVMVLGSKSFSLFHPNEGSNLHPLGGLGSVIYAADGLQPDLWATPKLRHARGWKGVLKAGEALYLPGNYVHQFQNEDLGPNIGLKFWAGGKAYVCPDWDCALVDGKADGFVSKKRNDDDVTLSIADYREIHQYDSEIIEEVRVRCSEGGGCKTLDR
eukprot:CAMPEP_0185264620 /NCGR_PEP_ID=MMETSP1359-20130426/24106_1 /TAXON_ID=552665 /ORGANISM="Bigelowiella longifila, Strain CCMP242" /LENGTH=211 /DNA_ID=CAMNT_0027853341 /DNA_START=105 /DNA_END=740 /DNA_ORIENTATION=-